WRDNNYARIGRSAYATGDFDGDGRLDFIQWALEPDCEKLHSRTVLAGSPPGQVIDESYDWPAANGCLTPTVVSLTASATQTFAADLDGDGRTDLVFLQYRRVDPFTSTDLRYEAIIVSALSLGDGKFTLGAPHQLWISANDAELSMTRCGVGDLNGDRR